MRGLETFNVPTCRGCGGMLKPDVVFFGENVPRERVDAAMRALDEADAMLVVGSSLMVYSGFRFCERAGASGKPIAAINRGRTRADHLFALKVERSCADVLTALVDGTRRRVARVERSKSQADLPFGWAAFTGVSPLPRPFARPRSGRFHGRR